MSIMDAIFDGKVYPGEQVVSTDPEYAQTNREIDALMKKLEEKLGREEYDMVEEVCDLLAVSQDIQNKAVFRYGLSLGLRLMKEASDFPFLQESSASEQE